MAPNCQSSCEDEKFLFRKNEFAAMSLKVSSGNDCLILEKYPSIHKQICSCTQKWVHLSSKGHSNFISAPENNDFNHLKLRRILRIVVWSATELFLEYYPSIWRIQFDYFWNFWWFTVFALILIHFSSSVIENIILALRFDDFPGHLANWKLILRQKFIFCLIL